MSLFDTLGSLTKAAVAVVITPVDLLADAITLGGTLTDQDKPYTAQRAEDIMRNLKDATK